MSRVIEAKPKDITEGKTFRWIKIWVTEDEACWTSRELANVWSASQNLDPNQIIEEAGFLYRKEKYLRVYRPRKDSVHQLEHRLEVLDKTDEIRARALRKLTLEEREALGV
jgi:hypothetical protein